MAIAQIPLLEGYNNISMEGLSCLSPPQEKKEQPTIATLRFFNGIKHLGGCLVRELLCFWWRGRRNQKGMGLTKLKTSKKVRIIKVIWKLVVQYLYDSYEVTHSTWYSST